MIQKLMFDCCAALKQTCWRISQRGSLIFDDIDCLVNWTLIWCQLLNEFMDEMIKKKTYLAEDQILPHLLPFIFLVHKINEHSKKFHCGSQPARGPFLATINHFLI
jgi:hypothetical protein